YYAIKGLTALIKVINTIKLKLNHDLEISGLLATFFDGRTVLAREMLENLRELGDHRVFNTMIKNTVKLGEAPLTGKPITEYASNTNAARAFRDLAREVSIIENLQREDGSPLEEAGMYRKMTDLGYSVRQLAQKIGKDKSYVENRLRLAEAPAEIRELVSVRKDTISHAYELMKLTDDRLRRRLAKRVAAGELSLAKLRAITGGDEGEPVATK